MTFVLNYTNNNNNFGRFLCAKKKKTLDDSIHRWNFEIRRTRNYNSMIVYFSFPSQCSLPFFEIYSLYCTKWILPQQHTRKTNFDRTQSEPQNQGGQGIPMHLSPSPRQSRISYSPPGRYLGIIGQDPEGSRAPWVTWRSWGSFRVFVTNVGNLP